MDVDLRRIFEEEDISMKNNKNFLSRNSSIGTCSSRIYYYRNAGEGIPFQWEMQPGTPKQLPKDEPIPPISPPPAVLSLGFPKPYIHQDARVIKPRFYYNLKLIRFWNKKSKKKNKSSSGDGIMRIEANDEVGMCSYKDERFEFGSSDGEFMSPVYNSSSSSLSSSSFSIGLSRQSSRLDSPSWTPRKNRGTLSCSPWDFRSFVSLAKRL